MNLWKLSLWKWMDDDIFFLTACTKEPLLWGKRWCIAKKDGHYIRRYWSTHLEIFQDFQLRKIKGIAHEMVWNKPEIKVRETAPFLQLRRSWVLFNTKLISNGTCISQNPYTRVSQHFSKCLTSTLSLLQGVFNNTFILQMDPPWPHLEKEHEDS